MNKKALSVTLMPDNLLWLEARARATGSRSLSAVLDAVLTEARQGPTPARSVVGRVRFPEGDEGLERGEKEIRQLLERSLTGGRPRQRRRG